MNEKLIFFDVDETLYSKQLRGIPKSTIRGLKQAQKNGHKILINTGRPPAYFEQEILDIGFDGFLCSNGAYITIGGQVIFHQTFSEEFCRQITECCERYHIAGALEGADGSYFRNHDTNAHPHYGFMISAFDLEPSMPHTFSWKEAKSCEKAIIFSKNGSDMDGFLNAFTSMNFDFDLVRIDDTQYEILAKGRNKGTALLAAAKHFNTSIENCYAFGDSNNDTKMLETAGTGIAMGNACDELKAIADYITTPILEDGIYNGLKHFGLIL